MRTLAGVDLFRWLQLAAAILGLIFAILTEYRSTGLIVLFSLTLLFLLIIFISEISGRHVFNRTVTLVIEVVLTLTLIGYTIYAITCEGRDVWLILAFVASFTVSALLIITAWEKI